MQPNYRKDMGPIFREGMSEDKIVSDEYAAEEGYPCQS